MFLFVLLHCEMARKLGAFCSFLLQILWLWVSYYCAWWLFLLCSVKWLENWVSFVLYLWRFLLYDKITYFSFWDKLDAMGLGRNVNSFVPNLMYVDREKSEYISRWGRLILTFFVLFWFLVNRGSLWPFFCFCWHSVELTLKRGYVSIESSILQASCSFRGAIYWSSSFTCQTQNVKT